MRKFMKFKRIILVAMAIVAMTLTCLPMMAQAANNNRRLFLAPIMNFNTNQVELLVVNDENNQGWLIDDWKEGISEQGCGAGGKCHYLNFPDYNYDHQGNGYSTTDEELANNIATNLQTSLNTITGLCAARVQDYDLKTTVKSLANNFATTTISGNIEIDCGGSAKVVLSPVSDPNFRFSSEGVNKGTTIKNFAKVRFSSDPEDKSSIIQWSAPKGYSANQIAAAEYNSVMDGVTGWTPPEFISIAGVAAYAQNAYEQKKLYASAETYDKLYRTSSNIFTKSIEDMFNSVMTPLANSLGLSTVDQLMFCKGVRGTTAYYNGIVPVSWMDFSRILYFFSMVGSFFIMIFGYLKALGQNSLSNISPTIRTSLKDTLIDYGIVIVLQMLFIPIFSMTTTLSKWMSQVFASLVGANRSFCSITGGWNFLMLFANVGINIAINFTYWMRAISVVLCFGFAPLFISSIVMDKRKQLFTTWIKELISNIFLQPIHAAALALMISVSGTSQMNGGAGLLLLFSFVPLTKWMHDNLFGLRGAGILPAAQEAAQAAKQEYEKQKSALNAGAVAATTTAANAQQYNDKLAKLNHRASGDKGVTGDVATKRGMHLGVGQETAGEKAKRIAKGFGSTALAFAGGAAAGRAGINPMVVRGISNLAARKKLSSLDEMERRMDNKETADKLRNMGYNGNTYVDRKGNTISADQYHALSEKEQAKFTPTNALYEDKLGNVISGREYAALSPSEQKGFEQVPSELINSKFLNDNGEMDPYLKQEIERTPGNHVEKEEGFVKHGEDGSTSFISKNDWNNMSDEERAKYRSEGYEEGSAYRVSLDNDAATFADLNRAQERAQQRYDNDEDNGIIAGSSVDGSVLLDEKGEPIASSFVPEGTKGAFQNDYSQAYVSNDGETVISQNDYDKLSDAEKENFSPAMMAQQDLPDVNTNAMFYQGKDGSVLSVGDFDARSAAGEIDPEDYTAGYTTTGRADGEFVSREDYNASRQAPSVADIAESTAKYNEAASNVENMRPAYESASSTVADYEKAQAYVNDSDNAAKYVQAQSVVSNPDSAPEDVESAKSTIADYEANRNYVNDAGNTANYNAAKQTVEDYHAAEKAVEGYVPAYTTDNSRVSIDSDGTLHHNEVPSDFSERREANSTLASMGDSVKLVETGGERYATEKSAMNAQEAVDTFNRAYTTSAGGTLMETKDLADNRQYLNEHAGSYQEAQDTVKIAGASAMEDGSYQYRTNDGELHNVSAETYNNAVSNLDNANAEIQKYEAAQNFVNTADQFVSKDANEPARINDSYYNSMMNSAGQSESASKAMDTFNAAYTTAEDGSLKATDEYQKNADYVANNADSYNDALNTVRIADAKAMDDGKTYQYTNAAGATAYADEETYKKAVDDRYAAGDKIYKYEQARNFIDTADQFVSRGGDASLNSDYYNNMSNEASRVTDSGKDYVNQYESAKQSVDSFNSAHDTAVSSSSVANASAYNSGFADYASGDRSNYDRYSKQYEDNYRAAGAKMTSDGYYTYSKENADGTKYTVEISEAEYTRANQATAEAREYFAGYDNAASAAERDRVESSPAVILKNAAQYEALHDKKEYIPAHSATARNMGGELNQKVADYVNKQNPGKTAVVDGENIKVYSLSPNVGNFGKMGNKIIDDSNRHGS